MQKISLLFIALIFTFNKINAQCSGTISLFPYNEGFETNNGGWQSGGTANDWAWGTPSKPIISGAGAGLKCWIVGGLTGSSYNLGERSYVKSPCFDFTNIPNPHIKFKIFWECEQNYDGANFQYTLNNGTTWINVGAINDPIDCLNDNWYNTNSVNYLTTLASPKHGWSGTVSSGTGSGAWVVAQHCLAGLGGQPNVQFRFTFGAGTSQNNFDGFAFDDVTIDNAPPNSANFTYSCFINPFEYQFTNTSALCPNSFTWDFGEPSSGINNTSSATNPTHQYATAGTYTVSLTVDGPCNASSTITKTITTINNTLTTTNVSCSGANNGAITSSIQNATGIVNYTLQPNNITNTSGNFNNLANGLYTVVCTDANGCNMTSTTNITSPNPIVFSAVQTPLTCNGANDGEITATLISGGVGTITYSITPNNTSNITGNFTNLPSNTYTVTVSDALCNATSTMIVTQPNAINITSATITPIMCSGSTGGIQAQANGGTGTLNYALLPTLQTNTTGTFTNVNAGTYTIVVADANNCTKSSIATITALNPIVISNVQTTNPSCNVANNGQISIQAFGGNGSLEYSIGSTFTTSSVFSNLSANTYTITVKDGNGCTATLLATLSAASIPIFNILNVTPPLCFNENNATIQTTATNGMTPITQYALSNGVQSATGNFSGLSSGNYTIVVSDANFCTNSTTINISNPSELKIESTTFDIANCGNNADATIKIKAIGGTGTIIYSIPQLNYQTYNGDFFNIKLGTYTVTVTDANLCKVTTTVVIPEKLCCGSIIVPTAFSPNNDGKNDELRLLNIENIELNDFIIVNRYGNMVFKAKHVEDRWDGKYKGMEAEIGTYYYLLKYKCPSTNKDYLFKGDITLLR